MPRPPEYDREAVVLQAMEVFWERGYSQTSIGDLVDATGLQPGSLYGAFGNKKGVFLEVLDYYNQSFLDRIAALENGPVLPAIRSLLEGIVDEAVSSPDHRGCLSVNALLEMAQHDEDIAVKLAHYNKRITDAFAGLLRRARKQGEIDARKDPETMAAFLVNNLWGMRVSCKSKPGRQPLAAIVDTVMSALA